MSGFLVWPLSCGFCVPRCQTPWRERLCLCTGWLEASASRHVEMNCGWRPGRWEVGETGLARWNWGEFLSCGLGGKWFQWSRTQRYRWRGWESRKKRGVRLCPAQTQKDTRRDGKGVLQCQDGDHTETRWELKNICKTLCPDITRALLRKEGSPSCWRCGATEISMTPWRWWGEKHHHRWLWSCLSSCDTEKGSAVCRVRGVPSRSVPHSRKTVTGFDDSIVFLRFYVSI